MHIFKAINCQIVDNLTTKPFAWIHSHTYDVDNHHSLNIEQYSSFLLSVWLNMEFSLTIQILGQGIIVVAFWEIFTYRLISSYMTISFFNILY